MKHTLRILALCALTFSIVEAWYSLGHLATYPEVFSVFPQVLRTTNVTLGMVTAVVALVDSAQQRRWWYVGACGVLVLLIAYAGYLPNVLSPIIPALNALSEVAGLRLFLLTYTVPTIVTALLILAGEILPHLAIPHVAPAHEHDEGLELHYSSLDT